MSFYGSTLQVEGLYPDIGSVFFGPYEVKPQEGPDDFGFIQDNGLDENWNVTDTRIRIEFMETNTPLDGEYNAWLISDPFDTLQAIIDVQIVFPQTTADWDDTMIQWTEDGIIVNYNRDGEGVPITEGETLVLEVTFDLTTGTSVDDTIVGTQKADRLSGFDGNDDMIGLRGSDTMLGGNGNDKLRGSGGDDALKGGSGRDTLLGAAGSDKLIGGSGADTLLGGGRGDRLMGGTGDDTLKGGRGGDTLIGARGDDTLTGNGGRDDFLFKGRTGSDIITDFKDGKDEILLRKWGASTVSDLTVEQVGSSVEISSGDRVITLLNTDIRDIGADDFTFL